MSVIKVDVPNKWASTRYEARIKANNYTIISQQFNDISHPWRQNIGSHHLPRYTRYRVIAGRVIKGGDCTLEEIRKKKVGGVERRCVQSIAVKWSEDEADGQWWLWRSCGGAWCKTM